MTDRVNPFDDPASAPEFEPKPKARNLSSERMPRAQLDQIAADHGFPSRQPQTTPLPRVRRKYTTGRNQQLNVKASATTIARFYALADAAQVPLGELFERTLDAYEEKIRVEKSK